MAGHRKKNHRDIVSPQLIKEGVLIRFNTITCIVVHAILSVCYILRSFENNMNFIMKSLPQKQKSFMSIYSAPFTMTIKKVSEYDQKIPQSHLADQPMAPRERAT